MGAGLKTGNSEDPTGNEKTKRREPSVNRTISSSAPNKERQGYEEDY